MVPASSMNSNMTPPWIFPYICVSTGPIFLLIRRQQLNSSPDNKRSVQQWQPLFSGMREHKWVSAPQIRISVWPCARYKLDLFCTYCNIYLANLYALFSNLELKYWLTDQSTWLTDRPADWPIWLTDLSAWLIDWLTLRRRSSTSKDPLRPWLHPGCKEECHF